MKYWLKDGAISKLEVKVSGTVTMQNEDRDVSRTTTYEFKDLGSTNGTFVNGERVVNAELADGDQIVIKHLYIERRMVPLNIWLRANHLLCSSENMSVRQMAHILGITYKTAWFMAHHIREAMKMGVPL